MPGSWAVKNLRITGILTPWSGTKLKDGARGEPQRALEKIPLQTPGTEAEGLSCAAQAKANSSPRPLYGWGL